MSNPYCAIFLRLNRTVICGRPDVRSGFTSPTPGIVCIISAILSAFSARRSKSSPYNFTATSSLTPVSSSLKRSSTGWLKTRLTPVSSSLSFSLIFSINSSLELAEVQLSISFSNTINISAISIGIGSVGISATPILATAVSTSGKFSRRISSIFVETSIASLKPLPGLIKACMAISPSSS